MEKNIEKKCFAIDLTWVRHGIVGGTELFACNILEGFLNYIREHPGSAQIFLLTAKDNKDVFGAFNQPETGMKLIVCNTESMNRKSRILWQNLKMRSTLDRLGVVTVLEPIYYKPFLGTAGLRYYTVIHDLQGWHYPQYFSAARILWMKFCWRYSVRSSERVVAISDFVRNDILDKTGCPESKVVTIPNAIVIGSTASEEKVLKKYGLEKGWYYYTVSSMLPHKNLVTLVRVLAILKRKKSHAFCPLVISGVGKLTEELAQVIADECVSEDIIITGYVSDAERNRLYRDCKVFLFPSIFEGFGMPPVEALASGVPVITTDKTSIKEVTGGLAYYVSEALEPEAWVEILESKLRTPDPDAVRELMRRYDSGTVAEKYLELMFPNAPHI